MKIFSKDFCKFTGYYLAIYLGPCRRSYILLVRKFRTSEMLGKWSPTSKVSDIKLSHYPNGRYIFFTCTGTRLSVILFKPAFWYLFLCLLRLKFENWLICQLCRFKCKSATAYLFHNFSNILVERYFTWIFIEWVSTEIFPGIFSPWPK